MDNNNQLQKHYGLFTAICMVVGIVIGSGVFFKAQDILNYTGGNMWLGILAWLVGGAVMILCAFTFANMATKYVKVNGVVDYAEAVVGERYAYMTGWFISTIYYPAMTGVLAWVTARYTVTLFDPTADVTSGLCMALGTLYLCLMYAVNVLSPRIAGKFQIATTVIKLIPLAAIVLIGTTVGLINGNTTAAFSAEAAPSATGGLDLSALLAGVAAATFAYDGWIISTSINAELKDPKKNLPIALVLGAVIIIVVYVLYFIGLTGGATVDVLRAVGSPAAFRALFGSVGGTLFNACIVLSCCGTLNGLMLACTRSLYSLSVRGQGPRPAMFSQLDPQTNIPSNSGVLALLFCAAWYFYFYASNLTTPTFGVFSFDSSELPIITIYAIYIPIFIMFIKKEGKQQRFKNAVMPALAVLAALFMMFVALYAHGIRPYLAAAAEGRFAFPVLFYLIVFAIIMSIGALFYKKQNQG